MDGQRPDRWVEGWMAGDGLRTDILIFEVYELTPLIVTQTSSCPKAYQCILNGINP